jgi:hypothetical protein
LQEEKNSIEKFWNGEILEQTKAIPKFPFPLLAGPKYVYASAGFTTGFVDFVAFAGRLLPNDPRNLLPFAVFLSPLPIV